METLQHLVSMVLHVDHYLNQIIDYCGPWTYVLLFAIIFCETGLVFTPFLPGDSLLFVLGTLAGMGKLDIVTLAIALSVAAVLGDTANYWIGWVLGPRIFRGEKIWLLNRKNLDHAHNFYERYGAKTIVLARFVPIVRTFAPFVAGMGKMTYSRFMSYNVVGGLVWIVLLLSAGYKFGKYEWVQKNLTFVLLGIVGLSILPGVVEFVRERRRLQRAPESAKSA